MQGTEGMEGLMGCWLLLCSFAWASSQSAPPEPFRWTSVLVGQITSVRNRCSEESREAWRKASEESDGRGTVLKKGMFDCVKVATVALDGGGTTDVRFGRTYAGSLGGTIHQLEQHLGANVVFLVKDLPEEDQWQAPYRGMALVEQVDGDCPPAMYAYPLVAVDAWTDGKPTFGSSSVDYHDGLIHRTGAACTGMTWSALVAAIRRDEAPPP